MQIDNAAKLVEAIRKAHLLEPAQLAEISQAPDAQTVEPRLLAEALVQMGWITAYQSQQLLRGSGQTLTQGPYRILELIGESRTGPVYKARHLYQPKTVALKVIAADLLTGGDTAARFNQEAVQASRLSHPHLAKVLEASQTAGVHLLTQEYLEGADLARLVRETGPLPVHLACEAIRQAALGLQHAHDNGLVHRQVSPSQMMLVAAATVNGQAGNEGTIIKVLGLGLGRLRVPRKVAATLPAAPEPADFRGDVTGLGKTLSFLLTGQENVVPERADVPDALKDIIRKLLNPTAEDGPRTAGDLARSLEPYCTEAPPPAPEPVPEPAVVAAATPGEIPAQPAEESAPVPAEEVAASLPESPAEEQVPDAMPGTPAEQHHEAAAEEHIGSPFSSQAAESAPADEYDHAYHDHGTTEVGEAEPRQQGMSRRKMYIWLTIGALMHIIAITGIIILYSMSHKDDDKKPGKPTPPSKINR